MAMTVGFIVFPGVQPLDLVGPFDVFATLGTVQQHLVWKDLTPVVGSGGLTLQPTTTFTHCPPLDVLCVPGGSGVEPLLEDEQTLAFIRGQAATAHYVTSVCTGALLLGAAGLLKGRRATTHWAYHELLGAFGAVPSHERVVMDGALITGGGVTAGIDFALTIAAEWLGPEQAQRAQLALEYAPAPPFDAGHPHTAPAAVLAAQRKAVAPAVVRRAECVARAAARLTARPM
ncbi:DJ-1/PfpI family protein [Pseudomonas sp. RIT-PI-S]|uniref:DJ-1/PfpI family protein n=1 Tax=Pseudomonas sp. RIT-PI-S TaxID=3035295 RepID=UPI0021D93DEB|nr:DJ-1/PfpI family protein [Pseudomonas sp. RIT-PI-S]